MYHELWSPMEAVRPMWGHGSHEKIHQKMLIKRRDGLGPPGANPASPVVYEGIYAGSSSGWGWMFRVLISGSTVVWPDIGIYIKYSSKMITHRMGSWKSPKLYIYNKCIVFLFTYPSIPTSNNQKLWLLYVSQNRRQSQSCSGCWVGLGCWRPAWREANQRIQIRYPIVTIRRKSKPKGI